MTLSLWQKFKMRLYGVVYLEHRTKTGWKGSLPFYAFKCPIHGIVEDRPYGHEERLECPQCTRGEVA